MLEVRVRPTGGEFFKVGEGDLVVFPARTNGRRNIYKVVRENYNLGD